jgi:hypothetical protein
VRCPYRTVAEVDGYLYGVTLRLTRVQAMTWANTQRKMLAVAECRGRLDELLDMRLMLAALDTLDADLDEMFRGIPAV